MNYARVNSKDWVDLDRIVWFEQLAEASDAAWPQFRLHLPGGLAPIESHPMFAGPIQDHLRGVQIHIEHYDPDRPTRGESAGLEEGIPRD